MSNNRINSFFGSVPKKCDLQTNENKCVEGVKHIKMLETNTISNPTDSYLSDASQFISFEPKETKKFNNCESDMGHFITRTNTINYYLKSVVLQ